MYGAVWYFSNKICSMVTFEAQTESVSAKFSLIHSKSLSLEVSGSMEGIGNIISPELYESEITSSGEAGNGCMEQIRGIIGFEPYDYQITSAKGAYGLTEKRKSQLALENVTITVLAASRDGALVETPPDASVAMF